jgi:hypothetical protein
MSTALAFSKQIDNHGGARGRLSQGAVHHRGYRPARVMHERDTSRLRARGGLFLIAGLAASASLTGAGPSRSAPLSLGWQGSLAEISELRRTALAGAYVRAAAVQLQCAHQGSFQAFPECAPDHDLDPLREVVADEANDSEERFSSVQEVFASGARSV